MRSSRVASRTSAEVTLTGARRRQYGAAEETTMNRARSRTILGLLVLVTCGIVTGPVAQPPGTSQPGASTPVVDLPSECLFETNHGACVTCCMEATDYSGLVCSRFCKTLPPPDPEPEP
jgi:hypothetical protein